MIRTVATTGSTNADLCADALAGRVVEGDWLRAVEQLVGRGRQGRHWAGEPGNLYASTLIVLRAGDPPATTLALLCGLALVEAIDRHAPPGAAARMLKWPNDVLLGEAKLAGILLERQDDRIIAGFGVNVRSAPPLADRRTAALADAGWRVDAKELLETLAHGVAAELEGWRRNGAGPVMARWLDRAHPLGSPVTVHGTARPDCAIERLSGFFAGLSATGALRLAGGDGLVVEVTSGDIVVDAGDAAPPAADGGRR